MQPKRSNRLGLRVLQLLLVTLPMPGCSSLTGGSAIDDKAVHQAAIGVACGAFEPITYSKDDTAETRRQIRAHDAVGAKVCGWTPATKPAP